MLENILSVIGIIFIILGYFVAWSILLNKKINLKSYKIYLSIILLILILIFNSTNVDQMLRITLITFSLSIFVSFNFKESIKVSVCTAFFTQIINMVGELIYSIVVFGILNVQINHGMYPTLIIFFADIFLGVFVIFLVKIGLIQKIYNLIISVVNKLTLKTVILWTFFICFVINIYLAVTYYSYNPIYYIVINNVSVCFMIGIIFMFIKKESDYFKIYDKYKITLNSLKEYEEILDKYRVSNHENKNQLLTIRNMISDKSKKTAKYIDEIVKSKLKDDEKIMQEVSIIPAGGLRGVVYCKILDMKQNQIEYELNISNDLRTVDLINKLNDSDILDICQIIGVYIDNAIDEVNKIKDKYISIELYLEENKLVFSITNYYEGKIELIKLEEKGYTTKGIGHGYGLSLAKEIINKNKKLENEKRLSKEMFTQVLKIKI